MNIYKTFNKSRLSALWVITGVTLALLLIFPAECRAGAANSVFLCIQVLIPSLFPFMVLSGFIVSSGISSRIPRVIKKGVRSIFGLPGETAAVILLALVGGYPVGARGINSLYREKLINEKEAQRMAMFCVASGPGFLVTYLGTSMMGNTVIGYFLLISQMVSVILLGVIARFAVKCPQSVDTEKSSKQELSIGEALTVSVSDGIKACGGMCGLVILFGAFCEIFLSITENNSELWGLTAFIEITTGTKILVGRYPTVMLSAACGFGGFCVHFQVFQQLGNIRIPKIKFFMFRIIQAVSCAVITHMLLRIFPQSVSVFSTVSSAEPQLYAGAVGCIFLILSCGAFLISVRNRNRCQ